MAAPVASPAEPAQGTAEAKPKALEWSGLLSADKGVIVWLVVLGFGGALLSLYYSHIQYFPELEWKESLTYLAALSILGGSIAVLYGLLLFVPGAMWSEFLIHDTELEGKMCYQGLGPEPCYWTVWTHMGLPFLAFMVAVHLAALAGDLVALLTALPVLAVLSWHLWRRFRAHLDAKKKEDRATEASRKTLLLKYVGSFAVSALASLASLLLLYRLIRPEDDPQKAWQMLPICTAVVTVTNLLVAVQFRRRPGRAVLSGILAALVLLGCGEIVSHGEAAVSTRLMEKFGVGEQVRHTMVVSAPGRQTLESLGIPLSAGTADGGAIVREAHILSRLGKEYYVAVGDRRVNLPREQVLSWSTEPPVPRPRKAAGAPGGWRAFWALAGID